LGIGDWGIKRGVKICRSREQYLIPNTQYPIPNT